MRSRGPHSPRRLSAIVAGFAALVLLAARPAAPQAQAPAVPAAIVEKVDAIFARWDSTSTPGCAVAASVGGQTVISKGYGMADLERGAVITPETIFEAGSVSKQFTAAAVLLLARDGKLSLDDPVRRYVPEVPDYGQPITIRHLLTHTSGLRDWGNIAALGGWPRTTRAYTHAHVLEIVSRQSALNFPPGTEWSYSNTGYNLAAILVSRVAGEPFAEFTRKRIFEPLGMARTSWRDDFTRVVPGRALAYSARGGGFQTLMPFENVHGNGGLLTTVGDLLKWNANLDAPATFDRAFVAEMERSSRLANGRETHYGLGLFLGTYKGVREVYHSGSTAGYRAFLTRFPDQRVSVATLCNVTAAPAETYAHQVAELLLGGVLRAETPLPAVTLSAQELGSFAGLYRSRKRGVAARVAVGQDTLRLTPGGPLVAQSGTTFLTAAGAEVSFAPGEGGTMTMRVVGPNGSEEVWERVPPAKPTPAELSELAGTYTSADAETTLTVVVEGDALRVKMRPDRVETLSPLYADAFDGPLGVVIFRRDARGRVVALSVVQDRAWDVRFERVAPAAGR
jgi:CubicO group peptidase (beta-lactamase class C family)